jgi:hypothetical protein
MRGSSGESSGGFLVLFGFEMGVVDGLFRVHLLACQRQKDGVRVDLQHLRQEASERGKIRTYKRDTRSPHPPSCPPGSLPFPPPILRAFPRPREQRTSPRLRLLVRSRRGAGECERGRRGGRNASRRRIYRTVSASVMAVWVVLG